MSSAVRMSRRHHDDDDDDDEVTFLGFAVVVVSSDDEDKGMAAGNVLNGNYAESDAFSLSSDPTIRRSPAHNGGPLRRPDSNHNAVVVEDDDIRHVLPPVDEFIRSRPTPVHSASLAPMPPTTVHIKFEDGDARPAPETPRHPPSSPAVVPASPPTDSSNGGAPTWLPLWTFDERVRTHAGVSPAQSTAALTLANELYVRGAALARRKCFAAD